MKIIFEKEQLLYGISLTSRIAPSRYPANVLATGLLLRSVDSETVVIISNNTEISLQVTLKARVEEPGEVVLPARFLADMVRRLPSGEITLSMSPEHFTVHMNCDDFNMDIAGMNPQDFPSPAADAMKEMWHAPQKALRDAMHSVSFAVSQDESRPAMTGMLLSLSPEGCRVIAMDGFRFAEKLLPLSSSIEHECIIPGKAVNELYRLLADDDEPFEARISNNHVAVQFGNLLFQSRLIDAPFPFKNAQDLVRKEKIGEAIILRKALIERVERALLVTREDAKGTHVIRLNFVERNLVISSNSPDVASLTEEMQVQQEGEDILIGFNGRYLLDILNVIEADNVHFTFYGSVTAAVIRPQAMENFVAILSPIRLS